MFEIFPWTHHFETGITVIDEQHIQLVQLLNRLSDHLINQTSKVTQHEVFEILTNYVDVHLQSEDAIWTRYLENDVFLSAHRDAHVFFGAEVQRLQFQAEESPEEETFREVVSVIVRWLASHVLEADQQMALICQAIDSGASVAEAKIQADKQIERMGRIRVDTVLNLYDNLFNSSLNVMQALTLRAKKEASQSTIQSGENTDISEQELAELVYQYSSQGMFVTDQNYQIMSVNPAFTTITGYSPEEVIGKKPSFFHHTSAIADAIELQLERIGYWEGEFDVTGKNSKNYTAYFTFRRVKNAHLSEDYVVGLFTDVTQIKRTAQQLWSQTNIDQLTGLPNRHQFYSALQDEINQAELTELPFTLLLIDLDEFKTINDGFGHEIGDQLLKQAAERITATVGYEGVVARIGGDEFAVILYNRPEENGIDQVIAQLLSLLAKPYHLGPHKAYISASIGVAVYPDDATNGSGLLKNADQAMSSSKKQGRNRFCYYTPAMQLKAQHRQRLISDMHIALKNQQFILYYQPIIDVKSGKVCKAEALVRWIHPELGMINPVEFISLAEETGLITPMGEYIYHQALAQLASWQTMLDPDFQISVNKSPVQFQQIHRDSDWLNPLQSNNGLGKNLIIEITEGVLMDNNDAVFNRLYQLKELGVQIAVDDFGTGYSSLSYLTKFQVDFIKIDRSFVMDLNTNPRNHALCEAMISMAHTLNILVVAEGVETEEQLTSLRDMGCDYVQGYFFSKPLPAKDFEAFALNFA